MGRPVRRFKPVFLVKEKRLSKDTAANDKISPPVKWGLPILRDPCPHLRQAGRAICFSKCFQCKRAGQCVRVSEDGAADNDPKRSVQPKQENLAGAKRAERSPRRGPKVHLGNVHLLTKVLEPSTISQSHDNSYSHRLRPYLADSKSGGKNIASRRFCNVNAGKGN